MPTDYVLYSNYERLVEALLAGEVDIGWNTNTAYVAARAPDRRRRADPRDARRRRRLPTVVVTRRGEAFESPAALGGQAARARQPRLRARRDPAAALPRASRASTPSAMRARALRHRPRQARRHRRLRAARRRARSPRATPTRARSATRPGPRCAPRGMPAVGRAGGRLAQPGLLPLQLHRAAVGRRGARRARGARRCWRWTTTIRRCGRRWTSRA